MRHATEIVGDDVTSNRGDVDRGRSRPRPNDCRSTYDFAIHTHGSIGPSMRSRGVRRRQAHLLVGFESSNRITCASGLPSMFAMSDADDCALSTSRDPEDATDANGHEDAAADASLLAREVNLPVRVQWMRADEHGWDPKGPPTLIDMQAALDASGNVDAWYSQFYGPDGIAGKVKLVAAELAGMPHETAMGPGGIIAGTADPLCIRKRQDTRPSACDHAAASVLDPFALAACKVVSPMKLSSTRSAVAANADPIELRRRYLADDARARAVLDRLAQLAHWQKPSSQKNATGGAATGRGMAFIKYENNRTYVGMVATVEIDRATGVIAAKHFAVVQDSGQIINPDGVKNQIEGNIVQTVSRDAHRTGTIRSVARHQHRLAEPIRS